MSNTEEDRNAGEHIKAYKTISKASKGSQTFYKVLIGKAHKGNTCKIGGNYLGQTFALLSFCFFSLVFVSLSFMIQACSPVLFSFYSRLLYKHVVQYYFRFILVYDTSM